MENAIVNSMCKQAYLINKSHYKVILPLFIAYLNPSSLDTVRKCENPKSGFTVQ